ncbi:MAG TPA: hypothetical protein VGG37_07935 [Opitutaceae bacterium]
MVVPLLILAIGVRIGISVEQMRQRGATKAAAAPTPLPPAPPVLLAPVQQPTCELAASFQNNVYPSLILSFGAAYPEYARCLTATFRGAPAGASLRIESDLFQQPAEIPVSGSAALSPELPWNYDALRRTNQLEPHSFVATLLVEGRAVAQAPLVCAVHSVNEAVSRILVASTGQWQDTSVCFAAFVNEDHPLIGSILGEALSAGTVRSFTGYQNGARSALAQVQAVWEALAARGLSYVNVATDSGTSAFVSTQYVRFLDQSLHDRGANCVDASVLFASILRRIGLRPVLLFRPGHCFTGFYDSPEGGHILAFETTMLGSAPFAAAAEEGAKELQATLPYVGTQQYSVVDIALCRQQGISPIPYQAPDKGS